MARSGLGLIERFRAITIAPRHTSSRSLLGSQCRFSSQAAADPAMRAL